LNPPGAGDREHVTLHGSRCKLAWLYAKARPFPAIAKELGFQRGMGLRNFRSTRYANVAATLALLFSLAGTGTPATYTVSRLTGKDVKDGSLTLRDLSPASITALASGGGGKVSSPPA
jgi:hypothetical protein